MREFDTETASRIRDHLAIAADNEDAFAAALVERLWILSPGIFALLRHDATSHALGVVRALRDAAAALPETGLLREALDDLAERHRAVGFVARDFHMFREALLLTLEARLRGRFDASDRAAWRKACAILAGAASSECRRVAA